MQGRVTHSVMAVLFEDSLISMAVYGIISEARTYHCHHNHYLTEHHTQHSMEANHSSPQGCKLSTRCSAARGRWRHM